MPKCSAFFRWCFKVDYHWFCRLVLQWRHIPWGNFISFSVWSKISELWQAITSAKINIFWCDFLFVQMCKGDSVSHIKKERTIWWLSSFKGMVNCCSIEEWSWKTSQLFRNAKSLNGISGFWRQNYKIGRHVMSWDAIMLVFTRMLISPISSLCPNMKSFE